MKRSVPEVLTIVGLSFLGLCLFVAVISVISDFVFIPMYVNFFADCNCVILFFAKVAAIITSILSSTILFLVAAYMADIF